MGLRTLVTLAPANVPRLAETAIDFWVLVFNVAVWMNVTAPHCTFFVAPNCLPRRISEPKTVFVKMPKTSVTRDREK